MTSSATGEDRRGLTLHHAGVQVRSDNDGGPQRFNGYAATFDERTAIGDPFTWGFYEEIAPGAFTDTLRSDDQRKLIDHNPYYVVSRVGAGSLRCAQDRHGLSVDSALDTSVTYVADLIRNIDNGNIAGMSFAFHVVDEQWWTERETRAGREVNVDVRRLKALRVPEVSSVTFPAYDATSAGVVAEDDVRAVGLALGRRPNAAALFEARARHQPGLSRYFEREHIRVRRTETRKAVPSHGTDTDDSAWDGPAEEKKLADDAGPDVYRDMYAWQDPDGDENTQAAWKFPHHFVDDDGTPGAASTKACDAVISILNGGRGGADIPDADRQGVWDHVAKHLRDAGEDPAELAPAEDDSGDDEEQDARSAVRRMRDPKLRNALRHGRSDWYRIEHRDQESGDQPAAAEVFLYDVIGGWFGVDANELVRDLAALDVDELTVRINSPGGNVFDGIAILNALRGHRAKVTTVVDGLAASAASFIAMAGEEVVMWRNSEMMIHDPWGLCVGPATDMRDLADQLDRIADNIASVYADRAGGEVADWRSAMLAETWYSAEEAVSAGLADSVRQPAGASPDEPDEPDDGERARRRFDLSMFTYAGRRCAPPPASRRTRLRDHRERRMASLAQRFSR